MTITHSLTSQIGDINNLGKRLIDYLDAIRPMLPNYQIAELDGLRADIEEAVEREYCEEEYIGID